MEYLLRLFVKMDWLRQKIGNEFLKLLVFAIVCGAIVPKVLVWWQLNQVNIILSQELLSIEEDVAQNIDILRLERSKMLLEDLDKRYMFGCSISLVRNEARVELIFRDYDQVVTILEQWLGTCTDDRLAWFYLGQAYHAEGYWAKAISAWQRAGALVSLQELGNSLAQQRVWSDTLLAYLAALELQPDNCIYRIRAGNATWWARQDLGGAMEQFREAIALCPDQVEGYATAGRVLIEAGNYPEAERWAMLGRRVEPSSEKPLTVLALSQLRKNCPAEAVPYLYEALRLNPNSTEAHALLGAAYTHLGLLKQAVKELEEAISLGPAAAWHYDALGIAYEKMGDRVNAIAAYKKALEVDPSWQGALDRLLLLQDEK